MDSGSLQFTPWQLANHPERPSRIVNCNVLIGRVRAHFDFDQLSAAINSTVRRRDNLRLRICSDGHQEVTPPESGVPLVPILVQADEQCLFDEVAAEHVASDFETGIAGGTLLKIYFSLLQSEEFVIYIGYSPVISDPHSMTVVLGEIVNAYRTVRSGRALDDAAPPAFANYAQTSRRLDSDRSDRGKYWAAALPNVTELAVPLYTNVIRRPELERRISACAVSIEETLSAGIAGACSSSSFEPEELIYSAATAYLGQLIDQDSFPTIVPSLRRGSPARGIVCGPCSIALPISNCVDRDGSFVANLGRLGLEFRKAHESKEYLVEEPARDLVGVTPRQRGAVVLICFLPVPGDVEDGSVLLLNLPPDRQSILLSLTFYLRDDGMLSGISCAGDNLDDGYVGHLLSGLIAFMESCVRNPEAPLNTHRLVPAAVEKKILADSCATKSASLDLCVHELFERQVGQAPDAMAIEYEQDRLTYDQLNRRANQIGNHIRGISRTSDTGGTRQRFAAICIDRSIDMVVAVLAVMKAGYAYVPIDPTYPNERASFILRDAHIDILLTSEVHLREKFSDFDGVAVLLDKELATSLDALTDDQSSNIPVASLRISVRDPVAVLYTSGSTGDPKGVVISHRGMVSRLQWMTSVFPFDREHDKAAHVAQLQFVRALWELFVPLSCGIKVVILASDVAKDPERFARYLGAERITRLITAPSLAQTLIALSRNTSHLRSLRYWFIGGEALSGKVVSEMRAMLPGVQICNLYGATEVHSFATFHVVTDEDSRSVTVPIGKAVSNTAVLVLDKYLRLVPPGVSGEMCVLGPSVANGYLNRPELTTMSFRSHPFGEAWDGPLYKTGDTGCSLADGDLVFVGRKDYQVKIRGIRIELGEIEAAILTCERVQKAVVLSSEEQGDLRLYAYVVPEPADNTLHGSEEGKREFVYSLRAHLERKLPRYMTPSYFIVLKELPLNQYGKVRRGDLLALHSEPAVATAPYVAPRNRGEALLCEIWSSVLGVSKVGVLDNFFYLGGHSLLAGKIMTEINKAFSVDLPVREVLERTNVEQLMQAIESRLKSGLNVPRIRKVSDRVPAPLTEELASIRPYLGKMPCRFFLWLRGAVNEEALRASINQLVCRHDALRLAFLDDGACILPLATQIIDLEVVDCSTVPRASSSIVQGMGLSDEILSFLSRPFKISAGTLSRWMLVRISDMESVLTWIVDHSAIDAPSIVIIKRELSILYEANCKGVAPALPDLELGYFDYAHWQIAYRNTPRYAAERASYVDHMRDVNDGVGDVVFPAALPPAHEREIIVDERARNAISEFCKRMSLPQSAFYTAAFHLALCAILKCEDIPITMPASDRRLASMQEVVGLFSYFVCFRSKALHGGSVLEFLESTKRAIFAALSHGCVCADRDGIPREKFGVPHLFHMAYRNFPGNADWHLFGTNTKSISWKAAIPNTNIPRIEGTGWRVLMSVERFETRTIANIKVNSAFYSENLADSICEALRMIYYSLPQVKDRSLKVHDLLARATAGESSVGIH